MALVYGQLESLKRIRKVLDKKGITRFNSTGELNEFLRDYDRTKEELFYKIEQEFKLELDTLQAAEFSLQKNYDSLKTRAETKLKEKISKLKTTCEKLSTGPAKNAFTELGNWYLLQILLGAKYILEKSSNVIIWLQTFKIKKQLKAILKEVNAHSANSQSTISSRFATELKKLEYTKSVITDINPLIAGAIGEHLVAKELGKLSDTNVLFNDFSLSFNPPIYNKKDQDRIYSIQIDHLLVTNAGIFIIETKNWSKESIERLDLRSPIKQIQRTGYALFVLLNSNKSVDKLVLKRHHWGNKQLPIRNVIAMINHKPKEKFHHVAIKKSKELNSYINHFEAIFDDSEVGNIAEHLKMLRS